MEYRTKASVRAGFSKYEDCGDVRFLEYQPGNGTRYLLTLARVPSNMLDTYGAAPQHGYIVSWVDRGSFVVPYEPDAFLHWTSVAKAFHCNKADAVVLSEVVGFITGIACTTTEKAIEEDARDGGRSARLAAEAI